MISFSLKLKSGRNVFQPLVRYVADNWLFSMSVVASAEEPQQIEEQVHEVQVERKGRHHC